MDVELDLLRRRRTVRRFTEEDVSQKDLETLLEAAMVAPSRLNCRPWDFILIRDDRIKADLARLLRVHPYLEKAPVVIAVCARPDASPTWLMDVSAAIENLLLGATALDLGATWVGSPGTVAWDMMEEHIRDQLGIPTNVRIPSLIVVGHPDQELPAHSREDRYDGRRVHIERWQNRPLGES